MAGSTRSPLLRDEFPRIGPGRRRGLAAASLALKLILIDENRQSELLAIIALDSAFAD